MKFIVKLLLVLAVLFAGCYYYKIISVENGFSVMDTKTYTSTELNAMVITGASLDPVGVVDCKHVTYWEIPFANKYYVAYDIVITNGFTAETTKGLYVAIIEVNDVNTLALDTLRDNVEKVDERINWIVAIFAVVCLVIIVFPTKKKKY